MWPARQIKRQTNRQTRWSQYWGRNRIAYGHVLKVTCLHIVHRVTYRPTCSGEARGFRLGGSRGVGSGEGLFPCTFLTFWIKMLHLDYFAHCFYRATHMQRIGIARYMLGPDECQSVCLSVTHKVTRRCVSMQINAINRKLRWTLDTLLLSHHWNYNQCL